MGPTRPTVRRGRCLLRKGRGGGSDRLAGMMSGMSGQLDAGLAKLGAHVASGSQPQSGDQK